MSDLLQTIRKQATGFPDLQGTWWAVLYDGELLEVVTRFQLDQLYARGEVEDAGPNT